MKDRRFIITNTSQEDFEDFCKIMSINKTSKSSKETFFKMILNNELVRDKRTKKLVIRGK